MADQLSFYFDADELRAALNKDDVKGVVVKSTVIFRNGAAPGPGIFTIIAQGTKIDGSEVEGSFAYGCPRPCNGKPLSESCAQMDRDTLAFYKSNNLH